MTVILACLGQAVEQDKRVHAIRNWRNQLIVFDDVDVMLTIEIDVGSEKFPLVHTMRGINRRTALDMHRRYGDPGQPGWQRGRAWAASPGRRGYGPDRAEVTCGSSTQARLVHLGGRWRQRRPGLPAIGRTGLAPGG